MKASKSKYGNSKVTFDGYTFDSKREGNVYLRLKDLQSRGYISDLQIHPKWELQPKLTETYVKHLKTKDKECERTVLQPITYEADFAFYHNGEYVVVDVKISKSLLPKEYQIKKKMMRYVHGITLTEVYELKDLAQFENKEQV